MFSGRFSRTRPLNVSPLFAFRSGGLEQRQVDRRQADVQRHASRPESGRVHARRTEDVVQLAGSHPASGSDLCRV